MDQAMDQHPTGMPRPQLGVMLSVQHGMSAFAARKAGSLCYKQSSHMSHYLI